MKKSIIQLFKGVAVSYLVTIVLLLFFSLLLTYASIDDNNINIGIGIITVVSLLIGSFYVTRKIDISGWVIGVITAGIYFIILVIITYLVTKEYGINGNSLQLLGTALTGGILGGIIGINTKNNQNE